MVIVSFLVIILGSLNASGYIHTEFAYKPDLSQSMWSVRSSYAGSSLDLRNLGADRYLTFSFKRFGTVKALDFNLISQKLGKSKTGCMGL